MYSDSVIILSLISLGFFGGFSHCIGMCGPFVITQTVNRLEKVPLHNFSNFERIKNLTLLPYHLGRITTYSIIGALCSLLRQNIEDLSQTKTISAALLLLASLFFLNLFLGNFFSKIGKKFRLPFKTKTLKNSTLFFEAFWKKFNFSKIFLSNLFKNPIGFNGYILGFVLGFIPCGLLYGAFLISASIKSPAIAALGMALFGAATFPALFLTTLSGYTLFKNFTTELKIIAKIIILVNSVMLFVMALSLIN